MGYIKAVEILTAEWYSTNTGFKIWDTSASGRQTDS